MGLFNRLAEQRRRQIIAQARPYLEDGEQVVGWVRARHARKRRGHGFAFVTERRFVIHWTGRSDGHAAVVWEDIKRWAVNPKARGGPILAVESEGVRHDVQIPVTSRPVADDVKRFLASFARWAPEPEGRPADTGASFHPHGDVEVDAEPRSPIGHVKRVAVTMVGIALVVVGLALLVLPGPGLLVLIGGLAVLASEYDWAMDALVWAKTRSKQAADKIRSRRSAR